MSSSADKLKLDIEELNQLLSQANRQRSKNLISLELRRLQSELDKLLNEEKVLSTKSTHSVSNPPKFYEVKINNYGWDETDTTVKLYITLKDVHQLPKEAVVCNFTEKSLDLHIFGLDNKKYSLIINNLCGEIDINHSAVKVKPDTVIVSLAKKVPQNWSHITGIEKMIKKSKSAASSDDNDPADGDKLMGLIKKMYQEGDDEMKKTIAKVWTENQEKNAAGLLDHF